MYYVYILKGLHGRYYVGSTSDIDKRLARHNRGGSVWTKRYKPWILVHKEEFESKSKAMEREKQIKSYKGGNEFKKLIKE